MFRTNSDSLRSCLCFRVFRINLASDFFNLLLAGFHQAAVVLDEGGACAAIVGGAFWDPNSKTL